MVIRARKFVHCHRIICCFVGWCYFTFNCITNRLTQIMKAHSYSGRYIEYRPLYREEKPFHFNLFLLLSKVFLFANGRMIFQTIKFYNTIFGYFIYFFFSPFPYPNGWLFGKHNIQFEPWTIHWIQRKKKKKEEAKIMRWKHCRVADLDTWALL